MNMMEIHVDLAVAENLGLLPNEYEKIIEILGREPNFTELSIFSVMWSEHCSYKNSIKYIKTLPREGGRVLVGAGEENAGLVDIGDGWAVAFKIESHNHPSAIEPYQGAATGVGGIHRDIFTMGARPIAALNSLRFGDPELSKTQHLIRGVVKGIGDYGNCLGVPTVGGEVYFNSCYNQNILVNAMSVGVVRIGETVSARADGVGNSVYIVGSATGKDGIHGATFASTDLTEDSREDLPSVQVGDPFQEKLLLEASLEAVKTGAVIGMQDMGAAGLTCSTSEMSAKSGTGMLIDLSEVPTRQSGMQPFEILLSESQERMLVVVKKGQERLVESVFEKWDLPCSRIGEVTDSGDLEFFFQGEKIACVPAHALVLGGGAPVYDRDYSIPTYLSSIRSIEVSEIPEPVDYPSTARKLLSSPNLVSRDWIIEQYDSTVRTNTLTTNDPSAAALIRVKGTDKALAITTDCNSSYVRVNPYKGSMIAVAEAARNIACSGGIPLAITNCLNFGNPYNQEVYWQFVESIKGMGEACRKFNTPVTGGNVSFYNQTVIDGKIDPVDPTPTIGMLGLVEHTDFKMTLGFKQTGDAIILIGRSRNDLNGSEYLRFIHNIQHSDVPFFDLDEALELNEFIQYIIREKWISSAHDLSEGGLFLSLLESGFPNNCGFEIKTDEEIRLDAFLFGESQNRVIISLPELNSYGFQELLSNKKIPFNVLGKVTGNQVKINNIDFGNIIDWKKSYVNWLHLLLEN